MSKESQNSWMVIDCPMCGEKHEVEVKRVKSKAIIKGQEVTYNEKYCVCDNVPKEESEFYPGKFVDENLISAQNAYREKNSLMTTYEIIELRDNYSLSQVDLAKLLGWGEATVSRYESKFIQDEAYDNILRIIKDSPEQALKFLERNKDKFDDSKYETIKNLMQKYASCKTDDECFDREMLAKYNKYLEPSPLNGNKSLDLSVLKSLITYIAKKLNGVYKVKLVKIMWYIDQVSFFRLGTSLTGLVYQHEKLGALPLAHEKLMFLKDVSVEIEDGVDERVSYKFKPNKNIKTNVFTRAQKKIIDDVIAKFKTWNTEKIVNYMHKELAYKKTKQGEIIPFKAELPLNEF